MAGKATDSVLHVVFHQFRDRISNDVNRPDQGIDKSHPVFGRIVNVIGVGVHDSVCPVQGVLDVPDREEPPVVSPSSRHRALQEHRGVPVILVQHDRGALYRFQVCAIVDGSCDIHGIDPVTGGEKSGETREQVTLIVVPDRSGEVQRVCKVWQEFLLEVDNHALTSQLVFRGFLLGRGEI